MGYTMLNAYCAACGSFFCANPDKVVCLILNGQKEPICRNCADRWNKIHRTDKGLPPISYGDAYDQPWADEMELP